MSLTAIIIILTLGLLLILIEFLVLPGTNISGIVGLVLILVGIYYSYKHLGTPQAHYVLGVTFIAIVFSIVLILRSETWQKISLKSTINSKVENTETQFIAPGDKGVSLTRLAPVGTVMVKDKTFEGKSGHKFIDPNTPIEVIKIEGNQLIVKPIE